MKQNVPGNITRDPVRNATLAFPGQLWPTRPSYSSITLTFPVDFASERTKTKRGAILALVF